MEILLCMLALLILGFAAWFFGHQFFSGLKTGQCMMKGQCYTRTGQPFFYWALIGLLGTWTVLLPCLMVFWSWQFFLWFWAK